MSRHDIPEEDLEDHVVKGHVDETRVYCEFTDTLYGPYKGASPNYTWCPHCGEKMSDSTHSFDVVERNEYIEVNCDRTDTDLFHYCPGCGLGVDGH